MSKKRMEKSLYFVPRDTKIQKKKNIGLGPWPWPCACACACEIRNMAIGNKFNKLKLGVISNGAVIKFPLGAWLVGCNLRWSCVFFV